MNGPGTPATPQELLEHDAFLRALARGLVADASGADDVVQQAYLAALTRPARYAGPGGSLRAWLAAIVRRVAWKRRRSDDRRSRHELATPAPGLVPSAAEVLAREEARGRVVAAVLRLDEPARSTLLLRYFRNLQPAAIARVMGVPVETVRTRIKRALERLRVELDAESGEDRGAWLAALAPLAHAAAPGSLASVSASASALLSSLVGGGLLVSAKTKLAAAVVIVIGSAATAVLLRDGSTRGAQERGGESDLRAASGTGEAAPVGAPASSLPLAPATSTADRAELPPQTAASPGTPTEVLGSLHVRLRWQSDAMPASDVGVTLLSWDAPAPVALALERKTGSDGSCRFEGLTPGFWNVLADRGGSVMKNVRTGPNEVELELGGVDLRGDVVDALGAPVRDAEVCLSGEAGTTGAVVARSDADGRFVVRAVALPTARLISARATGFAPSPLRYLASDRGDHGPIHLVLARRGGALSGRVVGPDRLPVAGALVQVGDERRLAQVSTRGDLPPRPLLLHGRSDADGRFAFPGVMTGRVPILVRKSGLAPWQGVAEVAAGGASFVEVELQEGATLSGSVRRADGCTVEGATVRVGASDSLASSTARSDAAGAFRFEHLAAGVLEVVAESDDDGIARVGLVAVDHAHLVWDARLDPGATLSGRVLDEHEQPVPECRIRVLAFGNAPNEHLLRETRSDREGRFALEGCRDRVLQVEVVPPVHGFTGSQFLMDVRPGGEELIVRVSHALAATSEIEGVVVDADERPVAGATVFARPLVATALGGFGQHTQENGRFSTGLLAPGRYSLSIQGAGQPAFESEPFDLPPQQKLDLATLRLPRGGMLRATLRRDDRLPVDAVDVRLERRGDRRSERARVEEGVVVATLLPGEYELRTSGGGCAPEYASFEIREGATTELELALASAPEVVLLVGGLDAALARLANSTPYAFVRICDDDGRVIADTSLPAFRERLPEWRIALQPGAYRLEVIHGPGVLASARFELPERGLELDAGEIALMVR